ncbi:DUF4097 family beta strand repeat-containing protein [Cecembia sp.]|uniref:DUF4097 family beta strand repeat-containing protein n=1 Tax=Cecembia sp. TaxID=1898110 RepID=UPI0025BF6499|nr:DUF4097 family beta strand repeat-containing protein [Cecembia sp.]
MKSFLFILAVLFSFAAVAFQVPKEKAILSWEFSGSDKEQLNIQSAGLSLNYTVWEEDQVLIELLALKDNKPIGLEDAQVQKKLATYQFNLNEDAESISIQVEMQKQSRLRSNRDNILLFFKIQGPNNMNTLVKSESGSITLVDLQGKQELQSNGGSIRAINCRGEIIANSAGGSFFVDNFEGKMELGAANGSVRIENFSGQLKARSFQGSMSLFEIKGQVNAETESGSIRANFTLPKESILLKSNGGSIDAVLPKDLPMSVNFIGGIVNSQHPNFQGENKKTIIKGTINGGGIPINFETLGATVRVDYR